MCHGLIQASSTSSSSGGGIARRGVVVVHSSPESGRRRGFWVVRHPRRIIIVVVVAAATAIIVVVVVPVVWCHTDIKFEQRVYPLVSIGRVTHGVDCLCVLWRAGVFLPAASTAWAIFVFVRSFVSRQKKTRVDAQGNGGKTTLDRVKNCFVL
jgi:hypothetical protein